jgi:2-polyprenyl-3-methyl-5-hydroxy-6-metoxy-1,4-benzoquinol methylase
MTARTVQGMARPRSGAGYGRAGRGTWYRQTPGNRLSQIKGYMVMARLARCLWVGVDTTASSRSSSERRMRSVLRLSGMSGADKRNRSPDVFTGCEQFFRPGYIANLIPSWIPALDGVEAKLRVGAQVADIGCGLGASTILLAQEYPNSRFTGSDYHDESIEMARKRAGDQGVADRVNFEIASASTFSGTGYDLAATFDCLHDMGDPLAAARHVRQALKQDGTWLIVEPYAADDIAGNMNPVGRVYYNASTLLCVPNALSQPGGFALGAQAGEAAIRRVVTDAGFTRFRRAAETPFNLVYEVRP